MRWHAPCASTASAACAIVAPKPSSIAPAGSRWSPRPSCCGTPSISAAPWTRYVGTVSQCRKQSLPISRPWAGATSISPAITSGPATANLTPTVSGLSGAALQPWPPWQPPNVPALSAWSESVPVLSGDPKKRFKPYPIGYFHIDIAEVRTEQGKLYLFVAIDRTSKFAFAELHEKATRRIAGDFLRHLIAAVPYRVHTVLTDNGTHFTTPGNTASAAPLIKEAIARGETVWAHAFEYACAPNDVDHRLTKPKHPWTNGQVERMNRTIKDATVRRYHYESHDQLRAPLSDFVTAYNFTRRLKTLKGLTPYEFICKRWTLEPERFRLDPLHQMPGLNNDRVVRFEHA